MNSESLAALAAALTSPGDTALTPEDKHTIVAALGALAASQGVIARQARLLKSYQHDVDSIDAGVAATLSRFHARLHAPPASAVYDPAKARAARETLLAEIQRAETLEGLVATLLNFAKAVAVIAA